MREGSNRKASLGSKGHKESQVNLTAGVLPTTADDEQSLPKEDPSVRLQALDDFLIDN